MASCNSVSITVSYFQFNLLAYRKIVFLSTQPRHHEGWKSNSLIFCCDTWLARGMALLTIFCCHICLYSFTAFSVINEKRLWPHLFHFRPYPALRHKSTTYHSYSGNWGRICSFSDNSICDSWSRIESSSPFLELLWFFGISIGKKAAKMNLCWSYQQNWLGSQ